MPTVFGRLPTLKDYEEQFLLSDRLLEWAQDAAKRCSNTPAFTPTPKAIVAAAAAFCAYNRCICEGVDSGEYTTEWGLTLDDLCSLSPIPSDRVSRTVSEMNSILEWY